MAVYEITSPDGAKFQITAPDDATPDAVQKYAMAMAPRTNPEANLPQTLSVAGLGDTGIPLPQWAATGLVGAGKTFSRIGQGMQQGFNALTGGDQGPLAAQVAEENRLYKPLAEQHPNLTALGEALPSMAMPMGAGGAMASIGRAALAGAVPNALEYGSAEERMKAAAMGGAGGAVGGAAGYGLGKMISPFGSDAATAAAGNKFGINLMPWQTSDNPVLKYGASALANLPGSASRMANIGAEQRGALNAAAMKTMGAGGDQVTPEAVQAGQAALGDVFKNVPGGVTVKLDETALNTLAKVDERYGMKLTADQKGIFKSHIDDILNSGGTIPGEQYQIWRSDIGQTAAGASNGGFKSALKGIQGALDGAFDRSAPPEAVAAMKTVRQQYSASKVLEKLANNTGDISPARLANVKLAPGDLGDLTRLAPALKGLPDSGTAPRGFMMDLLSNNLLATLTTPSKAIGLTGLPWITANALTRNPTKAYLTNNAVSPELQRLLIQAGIVPGVAEAGLLGRQ
jgi:hypothetical protein